MIKPNQTTLQLDWAFRIFLILDVYYLLSGYIRWFQTKSQLISPLIPKSTVFDIFMEGSDTTFKAPIVAGIILLTGVLFYSFQKKKVAFIFLLLAALAYKITLQWPW